MSDDSPRPDWKQLAADAWNAPGWKEAARQQSPDTLRLRRLMDSTASLDAVWREINTRKNGEPAPKALLESLAHQLRKGPSALREESCLRRISQIDHQQMREIAQRLTRERWSYDGRSRVAPWPDDEIEAFITAWRLAHDEQG
jgi:hypothetical protein